jgi:hypothetical protein
MLGVSTRLEKKIQLFSPTQITNPQSFFLETIVKNL